MGIPGRKPCCNPMPPCPTCRPRNPPPPPAPREHARPLRQPEGLGRGGREGEGEGEWEEERRNGERKGERERGNGTPTAARRKWHTYARARRKWHTYTHARRKWRTYARARTPPATEKGSGPTAECSVARRFRRASAERNFPTAHRHLARSRRRPNQASLSHIPLPSPACPQGPSPRAFAAFGHSVQPPHRPSAGDPRQRNRAADRVPSASRAFATQASPALPLQPRSRTDIGPPHLTNRGRSGRRGRHLRRAPHSKREGGGGDRLCRWSTTGAGKGAGRRAKHRA